MPLFLKTFLSKAQEQLFAKVADKRFVWLRVSLALSGLACLLGSWTLMKEQLDPSSFHLRMGAFRDIPRLPLPWLPCFQVVLAAALGGLALGYKTRLCSLLACLGFAYWYASDPISGSAHMKLLASAYAFIALCPLSLRDTRWPLLMAQGTLVAIYFLAGWRKAVFGGWLENPDTLRIHLSGPFRTELGAWALAHVPSLFFSLGQYASLAFELAAPLLFLDRRLRPWALGLGIAFHLAISLLMDNLAYFSVAMLSFYWAFAPELPASGKGISSGQAEKKSPTPGASRN